MTKHIPGATVILFAEAKTRIRELVGAMLTEHGYVVISTSNGEEALIACRETGSGVIDMLLTNIVMPGMSGFELADAIRAQRPNIKAVVISSHMDKRILKDNPETRRGVKIVVHNEFLPLNLLKMIEEVLDNEPTATSAV